MKQLLLLFMVSVFLLGFSSNKICYLNKEISTVKCDVVLEKQAFDICYSKQNKHPKIVAYALYSHLVNLNNFKRKNYFKADFELPKYMRSYPSDFYKSSWDKGHNANNANFDYNVTIQKETFLMSNITPQAPKLNRIVWNRLEKQIRNEAVNYSYIEVLTGSCGSVGKIKNKINIPKYWFKIVYIPQTNIEKAYLIKNTNNLNTKLPIDSYLIEVNKLKTICSDVFFN